MFCSALASIHYLKSKKPGSDNLYYFGEKMEKIYDFNFSGTNNTFSAVFESF